MSLSTWTHQPFKSAANALAPKSVLLDVRVHATSAGRRLLNGSSPTEQTEFAVPMQFWQTILYVMIHNALQRNSLCCYNPCPLSLRCYCTAGPRMSGLILYAHTGTAHYNHGPQMVLCCLAYSEILATLVWRSLVAHPCISRHL